MRFPRSSGILLHITSLPGPWGVGDLGPAAYDFANFLRDSGQQLWQLLPLGPAAYGNSPYSSYSAFAGNPLLISPEQLVIDGYLSDSQLAEFKKPVVVDLHQVDFESVEAHKWPVLDACFRTFQSEGSPEQQARLNRFCHEQAEWLEDFSLFAALAEKHDTLNWADWPAPLAGRDPSALDGAGKELAAQIEYAKFIQFLFFEQWAALKSHANDLNIRMFGDMPIFVAHSSADVWANQSLFWLDEEGLPTFVAGVPPDYFSETGQRWGNPLYNWKALAETNYAWWTNRFKAAFNDFDLIRIDHFRGFEAYWEIPATEETAVNGRWVKGPGAKVFRAAEKALGQLPIVAEDLGLITDEVHDLRDELNFPGMRVLQFGYDDPDQDYHKAESYPKHSVAYTGTHDNDTVMSWYAGRDQLDEPSGVEVVSPQHNIAADMHWVLISMVFESEADTTIVPLQDVLGLGNEARMNRPGEPDGNWTWRCTPDAFSRSNSERLRHVSESAQRCSPSTVKAN